MREVFRLVMGLLITVLLVATVGALMRPGATNMASSLELIVRPETVVQLEAQRQQAALAAAQVQAQSDAVRADAVTVRLALVLLAIVVLAIIGGSVTTLRNAPVQRVTILLPNDPRFNHALHVAGGQRINGRPLLDGREVAQLEVVDMEVTQRR